MNFPWITSRTGIPISLDKDEYEICQAEEARRPIDPYSYELGVMDCFCEMVAAGLKTLALSHPCDTREERDAYLLEVKRLCGRYEIQYYAEDEPLLTDLFPEELNRGKYLYLFYRSDDVLDAYLGLKEKRRTLMRDGAYAGEERREVARAFGRLLSYPEEGIGRLLQKTEKSSLFLR